MDDSQKSGGFLSGGVNNQFLTNKAGEASASKIGMQEISFIKRDQASFVDTFLEEQEKLLEAEKYQARQRESMPEESLLGGSDDPMTLFSLFQDVVAEEFDLDVLVDEEPEQTSEQVTFEEDKEQDNRESPPEAERPLYMINTICERDEEHEWEDSDSEGPGKGSD
jgi:hypothetical protein